MKIEYFGHSCFRLVSNNGTSVVTDPYTKVGYELPQGLSADVVTVSHHHFDHDYVKGVHGIEELVSTEDGHVFEDVAISGFVCNHDDKGGAIRGKNIVYFIDMDGLRICHFGDLGEPCSKELLAKIGKVDVLLIPIGGTYTIDAVQAKEYIEEIQPKIVIPMHYKPIDGALDITDEKTFLSQFNTVIKTEKGQAIDVREYISNEMQILFMERKNNA